MEDRFPLEHATAAQSVRSNGPRPDDVGTIRECLERQIAQVREMKLRAREIGDIVFGPRPEPATGSVGIDAAPQSISDLLRELDAQISGLSSALARF